MDRDDIGLKQNKQKIKIMNKEMIVINNRYTEIIIQTNNEKYRTNNKS